MNNAEFFKEYWEKQEALVTGGERDITRDSAVLCFAIASPVLFVAIRTTPHPLFALVLFSLTAMVAFFVCSQRHSSGCDENLYNILIELLKGTENELRGLQDWVHEYRLVVYSDRLTTVETVPRGVNRCDREDVIVLIERCDECKTVTVQTSGTIFQLEERTLHLSEEKYNYLVQIIKRCEQGESERIRRMLI